MPLSNIMPLAKNVKCSLLIELTERMLAKLRHENRHYSKSGQHKSNFITRARDGCLTGHIMLFKMG